jgi:hypothetical protein
MKGIQFYLNDLSSVKERSQQNRVGHLKIFSRVTGPENLRFT